VVQKKKIKAPIQRSQGGKKKKKKKMAADTH
jgi:hypothetical protein